MMRKTLFGLLLASAIFLAAGGVRAGINVGDIAPDFTVLNQWNEYTTLYDSLGKIVLVDFSASR